MIAKQWQLAIDHIEQFAGEVKGDTYSDIVWADVPISESELISKYNEIKRNLIEWQEMIAIRDKLLSETDWTQSRDVLLTNDTEWQDYRQALRDITEAYDPVVEEVVWPTKPV